MRPDFEATWAGASDLVVAMAAITSTWASDLAA